jgi:hypothetical protein
MEVYDAEQLAFLLALLEAEMKSNTLHTQVVTEVDAMIPPVRTDPVWGRAQSSPVQMEGWTGLDHRLPVLDWTGLVWTSLHALTISTLFHSQLSLKT